MTNNEKKDVRCSFCGKHESEVKKILAGPNGVFICNECLRVCEKLMNEKMRSENDGAVTVRDRDTMEQVRIPVAELKNYFEDKFRF